MVFVALATLAIIIPGIGAQATYPGASGKVAYSKGTGTNAEIYVMEPNGRNQTRLTNNSAEDVQPSWSPDGAHIAFVSSRDGDPEIYVMNADGTDQRRITTNPGWDFEPTWSPDGTKIAFERLTQNYSSQIFVMNADGSNVVQLTQTSSSINDSWRNTTPDWSPDGTTIAFVQWFDDGGDADIFVMSAVDGSELTRLTSNGDWDTSPSWSPDGTKIAFASDRTRVTSESDNIIDDDIYVMNADGSDQVPLFASNYSDQRQPVWSPDGTKVIFTTDIIGGWQLFKVNADGSGADNLMQDNSTNLSPTWQPCSSADSCPGGQLGAKAATNTGLSVKRGPLYLRALGSVSPRHPREDVSVVLYKQKDGRFKVIASKTVSLDDQSEFTAKFARRKGGICKVVARFLGDGDHKPSSDSVRFNC